MYMIKLDVIFFNFPIIFTLEKKKKKVLYFNFFVTPIHCTGVCKGSLNRGSLNRGGPRDFADQCCQSLL